MLELYSLLHLNPDNTATDFPLNYQNARFYCNINLLNTQRGDLNRVAANCTHVNRASRRLKWPICSKKKLLKGQYNEQIINMSRRDWYDNKPNSQNEWMLDFECSICQPTVQICDSKNVREDGVWCLKRRLINVPDAPRQRSSLSCTHLSPTLKKSKIQNKITFIHVSLRMRNGAKSIQNKTDNNTEQKWRTQMVEHNQFQNRWMKHRCFGGMQHVCYPHCWVRKAGCGVKQNGCHNKRRSNDGQVWLLWLCSFLFGGCFFFLLF